MLVTLCTWVSKHAHSYLYLYVCIHTDTDTDTQTQTHTHTHTHAHTQREKHKREYLHPHCSPILTTHRTNSTLTASTQDWITPLST